MSDQWSSDLSPEEVEEVERDIDEIARQILSAILDGDDPSELVNSPLRPLLNELETLGLTQDERRRVYVLALRAAALSGTLAAYLKTVTEKIRESGGDVGFASALDP